MAAPSFSTNRTSLNDLPGSVIDMMRRRRPGSGNQAAAAGAGALAAPTHELGVIARRYGLMTCEEQVVVREVVASSGDLAIADRLAFITALDRHIGLVVIAGDDGSYHACIVDVPLDHASLADFVPTPGAPRVMSIVSERGITPALGPLACA